jgi:hypothetical protein
MAADWRVASHSGRPLCFCGNAAVVSLNTCSLWLSGFFCPASPGSVRSGGLMEISSVGALRYAGMRSGTSRTKNRERLLAIRSITNGIYRTKELV